jgi:hypothetical protein
LRSLERGAFARICNEVELLRNKKTPGIFGGRFGEAQG